MGLTSWAYSLDAGLYLLQSQDHPPPLWWPEEFRTGWSHWRVDSLQTRYLRRKSKTGKGNDGCTSCGGKLRPHGNMEWKTPRDGPNELHDQTELMYMGLRLGGDSSSLGFLIYWWLHFWEVFNSRSKHVLYVFLRWHKSNYNKTKYLLSTRSVTKHCFKCSTYINLFNPHNNQIELVLLIGP